MLIDPREQPRCPTCGHRRIYHRTLIRTPRPGRGGYTVTGELVAPCSIATDTGTTCGCRAYPEALTR